MSCIAERVRVLRNAERMLGFGARRGTVCTITGLSLKEIQQLVPRKEARAGRWPSSIDWYHTANLAKRVEASLFAVHYWRNRRNEFEIVESLIDAYGRYLSCVGSQPSISFDRAVNLVCHLEGNVWGVGDRSFDIAVCPQCKSQQLIQVGYERLIGGCIFCKFVQRYVADARLQAHFPTRSMPEDAGQTLWTTDGTQGVETRANVESPQK